MIIITIIMIIIAAFIMPTFPSSADVQGATYNLLLPRSLDSILRPHLQCTISTPKGAFLAELPIVALQANTYSLNVQEWKSTLLGVILGITSFGVEIHAQNIGIHSQKSDPNHYFGVDSTILRVDFHSKRSDP